MTIKCTPQRYHARMQANHGVLFPLSLNCIEVGLLHGAIRLMLLHPEVKDYSDDFQRVANRIRSWCLIQYARMGFTPEEIEALDTEFAEEEKTMVENKKGELLKALSDGPGQPLRPDGLRKLYETWAEVYLAFNMFMSESPTEQAQLRDLKFKLTEAHEIITSLKPIKDAIHPEAKEVKGQP